MKDKNIDIRWIQRFNNYKKALASLQEAAELAAQRELSKLEKQGVIQAFEFTHELAWKTLKDFLEYRGQQGIYGPRDATRLAFKLDLIQEGDVWMTMIEYRNKTVHTYDEQEIEVIYQAVLTQDVPAFEALAVRLEGELSTA